MWLGLGRLGTVGRASALALAGVLSGMLRIAAALSLTVVLALAGVLGRGRRILPGQDTGACGRIRSRVRVAGNRLSVEAGRSTAKQARECRGQSERTY